MKTIFYSLVGLFSMSLFAQAPANYYNSATGTGYQLKTQLHNIIKDHTQLTYNELRDDVYKSNSTINGFRDKYYENDNTILDIYSENPNGTDPYNFNINNTCGNYSSEGDCYNREHLIPQSYFNSQSPMYSDAFHVWPTDGKVNGWRNNLPFGVVSGTTSSPCNSGATNTPCHSQNGSKKGSNLNSGYSAGFSGTVFEPIDEFKGDIARVYFYFATRYQDKMSNFYNNSSDVKAMFDGSNDKVFNDTFLSILLQWHQQDPVSQRELDINDLVYSFQENRNPFIDNPDYAYQIWGIPASVSDIEPVYVSIYPNPSKDQRINITTDKEIEEIRLINLNGQIIQQIKYPNSQNNTYTLDNLPSGFYILNLNVDNQNITKKVIIN